MGAMNKAKGNMYDFVTHVWNPIRGCPHQCSYCLVRTFKQLPPDVSLEEPFPVLGKNHIIFVGHLCDMFAERVPGIMIDKVMGHCLNYDQNVYVFQTKNPRRIINVGLPFYPHNRVILGTTIETNRQHDLNRISVAPSVVNRVEAMRMLRQEGYQTFVTIEPVMAFDAQKLVTLLEIAGPDYINIGADSKGHSLREPNPCDIIFLIEELKAKGFDVRLKDNLARLIGKALNNFRGVVNGK